MARDYYSGLQCYTVVAGDESNLSRLRSWYSREAEKWIWAPAPCRGQPLSAEKT